MARRWPTHPPAVPHEARALLAMSPADTAGGHAHAQVHPRDEAARDDRQPEPDRGPIR